MARHILSDILCGVMPAIPESALRTPCDVNSDDVGKYSHKHQCPNCGNTWAHNDITMLCATQEEHVIAHTCAKCNTPQYWKC